MHAIYAGGSIRLTGPLPDSAMLRREELALALTSQGFPMSASNLCLLAHRGTGPSYFKFGGRVLYNWGESLQWAKNKLEARTCTRAIRAA